MLMTEEPPQAADIYISFHFAAHTDWSIRHARRASSGRDCMLASGESSDFACSFQFTTTLYYPAFKGHLRFASSSRRASPSASSFEPPPLAQFDIPRLVTYPGACSSFHRHPFHPAPLSALYHLPFDLMATLCFIFSIAPANAKLVSRSSVWSSCACWLRA